MEAKLIGYRCSLCGAEYTPAKITYTCPEDGGNLDVILDYAAIRKHYRADDMLSSDEPGLWRYCPCCRWPTRAGSARHCGRPAALGNPYIRGERGL